MKKQTILCSTLIFLSMGETQAFLPRRREMSHIRTTSTAPLSPTVGSLWTARHSTSSLLPSCTQSTTTALNDMVGTGVFDPLIEAELCTTMAHVALDFTTLVSPSRSLMRFYAVIGRVFAISADYLPDHSIHTEELMIQLFLLGLAVRELVSDRVGILVSSSGGNNNTEVNNTDLITRQP